MKHEEVLAAIRDVKDFPVPGIIFKDITTVLSNPEYLKWKIGKSTRLNSSHIR